MSDGVTACGAGRRGQPHAANAARPSVSALLKAATTDLHRSVEQVHCLRRCLAPDYRLAEYVELLRLLHGFHSAVELRLMEERQPRLNVLFRSRLRSADIEADLIALGATGSAGSHPQLDTLLPALEDHNARLGAAYVLEGSALGGKLIGKALRASLGPGIADSLRFHRGNARNTARAWQAFLAVLDAEVGDPARAAAAAQKTFQAIERWLGHVRPLATTGR